MSEEPTDAPGLVYPCVLDIKLFLESSEDNFALVREVLLEHVAVEDLIRISSRHSSRGRYQSLSCKVRANSREQMDDLFRALSAHPDIIMVI